MRFQVSKPVLRGNEKKYACDAIESGWISSNGPYIGRFETAVASRLGLEECIAVNNGTAALHLACLAMNLQPGQDVLMPTLTYVATANAVRYCGADPVLVDCDASGWNCTAELLRRAWTGRTVGVVVVHLYGNPARADEIAELCGQRGAWLIEDCAESLGAKIRGRYTGTFGDAATFSFYGNKMISTGEGGMLYVRDPNRRRFARMLRGQGMDPNRRYWHPVVGYNYRMTNVAAAIGLGQMEMFDHHLGERHRIARRYLERLGPLAEAGELRLPSVAPDCESSYWLYAIVLNGGGSERRDKVIKRLEEKGIETRPFFTPMHRLPMYASGASLPVAEALAEGGMNLPTYTGLTDEEIDEICVALIEAVRATR